MPVMAVETASRPRRKVQGLTGSVADISSRFRTASRPSAFRYRDGQTPGLSAECGLVLVRRGAMSAENEAVVRRYLTQAFAAVRDGDLRATRDSE